MAVDEPDKRPRPGNQVPYKPASQVCGQPTADTSGGADVILLHRTWDSRPRQLDDRLQKKEWWKQGSHDGNAFSSWMIQPMTEDPYQNVKSVVGVDKNQPRGDPRPQGATQQSEAAATSGST
ncbi:hypothetical protein F5B20DRAFT_563029 [Whalleya microplaca]|nr:hypothetical protein F5B20DRAFT_563029 [Whalleya microplaca]